MTDALTTRANEQGTYTVDFEFDIIPNVLAWTLTDVMGNVINGRTSISITPAKNVTVVLSGDDLALTDAPPIRVVTIRGTFDKAGIGTDLPVIKAKLFEIEDLVAVG